MQPEELFVVLSSDYRKPHGKTRWMFMLVIPTLGLHRLRLPDVVAACGDGFCTRVQLQRTALEAESTVPKAMLRPGDCGKSDGEIDHDVEVAGVGETGYPGPENRRCDVNRARYILHDRRRKGVHEGRSRRYPELQRLGDVIRADAILAGEIGDRPRDLLRTRS